MAIGSFVLASVLYVFYPKSFSSKIKSAVGIKPRKLNILVLSTCSLRGDRMGMYGRKSSPTRAIDFVANKSFIFDNAITDMSWSNVSGFLSDITFEELKTNGYEAIGREWTKSEIFWQKLRKETPAYYFRYPNALKSPRALPPTPYKGDLELLKERILASKNKPFFMEAHNKIMHIPYGITIFGNNDLITNKLSAPSREYYLEYFNNLEKYPERIPLSLFLSYRTEAFTEHVIKVLKLSPFAIKQLKNPETPPSFVGILNNVEIMDKWKNSKYFKRDLEIIKEAYDLRLKEYDKSLKDVLNLYGDKELQDNTVIIFTGDHGEAFFEHGFMIHGETTFDEMIKFPLFVKFPNQESGERIHEQFYQQGIMDIVKKIMVGEINQDNFKEYIEETNNHPMIISRTCSKTIHSLRYKNEWKYVKDLRRDRSYLYDLKNDPGETVDVFDANPEISTFLEESFPKVQETQPKNKMIHLCVPEGE